MEGLAFGGAIALALVISGDTMQAHQLGSFVSPDLCHRFAAANISDYAKTGVSAIGCMVRDGTGVAIKMFKVRK